MQTLSFSWVQNMLYGARDALYVISATTGQPALVGSSGFSDVRGMDFVSLDVVWGCMPKASSLGCAPFALPTSFSVSKSGASPTDLIAGPAPGGPNLTGILLFGTTHSQPFLTSFGHLCLSAFMRAGAFPASPGGDPGLCNGLYKWDLDAIAAAYPSVQVGTGLWVQAWYRDPGFPPPGNANLTNEIGQITVVP